MSSFEMYLRIKPTSTETKEEENIYQILNPSTLLTKLPSFESNVRNSSRKSSEATVRRHVFTKIFGSETSQAEMFEQSIKHRVAEFLDGKSSTIMTYGTRDSGKTYTLFGTSTSPGIIMRSIQLVFSKKRCCLLTPKFKNSFHLTEYLPYLGKIITWDSINSRLEEQMSTEEVTRFLENSQPENLCDGCKEYENLESHGYVLLLSFLEIYNEKIYDLLEERGCPVRLTNEKPYIYGSQMRARTALEACKIFLAGQSRMRTTATSSNSRRSRSHTIFKMTLTRFDRRSSKRYFSTLTFSDLAGSTQFETYQKKSDMREASFINNSLLVLGRCLKAVSKNQVAPFRESKLTKLFESALSGQQNLSFIVNVALTPNFYNETQNIFNFCDVAEKLILIDTYKKYKKWYECEVTNPKASDNVISTNSTSSFIHPLWPENEKINYIAWEACQNIQVQNKKLMKELETTKNDILNREYAIRKELADHYSRMIEEMEATHKKHTQEIETERHDLLKWSVKQVKNFYKERIDNLRHKKRKRRDSGDYIEDSHALYEELETENAQVTSEMMLLKETMKKLRDENKTILCKKNKCSFELALITKELKKFRQLMQPRMRWNIENDPDHFVNNLERLMYEKIIMTEMKLKEINEYICVTKNEDIEAASKAVIMNQELSKSENLSNDTLNKIKELEEELSRKEVYIVPLKDRIQMQEIQLAEAQQCLNDIKDDDMKDQKYKCNRSTNISFHDYAVDRFFEHDNVLVSSVEKNFFETHTSSPTADKCNFDDWIVVPKLFATPTHEESAKKSSNISDTDRGSFFENSNSIDCNISSDRSNKDDSGVSSGLQNGSRRSISVCDTLYSHDNEDTQTCLGENILTEHSTDSKKQDHKETLHSTELSENLETIRDVIYALNEAACMNEHKIIQHECQLLYEEEVPKRSIEEKREIAIKCDLSKITEDKMQEYKSEINELTRKLIIKEENQHRIFKCLEKYIERYTYLEKKLSSMNNQLDKASNKCANEHLPRIESLEDEVVRKTLQINELDENVVKINFKSRFSDYKNNSAFLNGMYKTYDDNQDEIIRLKMQLEDKELETSLLKNRMDATIQEYEFLVKHLQNEIKEKDKQFKTVPNNLNNLEKSFSENSSLFEFDSLHELKPNEDQDMSRQSIESLKDDETDCSLTDSIGLVSKLIVPKHDNSGELVSVSSVLSEDSTTSFNEKDSIEFESHKVCSHAIYNNIYLQEAN